MDAPEIVVKLVRHLGDLFEMVSGEHNLLSTVVFISCQGHGALKGVADLTSVPHGANGGVGPFLVGEEGLGVVEDVFVVEVDQSAVGQLGQVCLPDPLGVLPFERGVVECHVQSRLEGFVKDAYSVAREEEDAFVVFQNAEEDWRLGRESGLLRS